MPAETELKEYLDEIRHEVCGCCVERPPGGPPCAPLGKRCGVEMHLPRLVDAIHDVHSDLVAPYLDNNRQKVCEDCALLNSSCPCPMDYLAVLVVEAVEAVDRRRARGERGRRLVAALPGHDRPGMAEVARAYTEAAGTWVGCEWPTSFGLAALDLRGWTAAEAGARAAERAGTREGESWEAAARWLRDVERKAVEAEAQAALAVAAANAGEWRTAAEYARRAWEIEFSTGKRFRHQPPTWRTLCEVLEAAARQAPEASEAAG